MESNNDKSVQTDLPDLPQRQPKQTFHRTKNEMNILSKKMKHTILDNAAAASENEKKYIRKL